MDDFDHSDEPAIFRHAGAVRRLDWDETQERLTLEIVLGREILTPLTINIESGLNSRWASRHGRAIRVAERGKNAVGLTLDSVEPGKVETLMVDRSLVLCLTRIANMFLLEVSS